MYNTNTKSFQLLSVNLPHGPAIAKHAPTSSLAKLTVMFTDACIPRRDYSTPLHNQHWDHGRTVFNMYRHL
jgi:hypothetical protein